MAYSRRNVSDGNTVMNADLYNNLQDGIDENASIGNQALAIAKGRNQSLAYNNYSEMITALNSMGTDELKRGQNIYIGTVGVPDLWVYDVETSSVTYTYVDDETIVNSLGTDTTIQVGYYKLAQLETQKVDLTNIESDINDLQSSDTDINALITALTSRITQLENAVGEWTLLKTITYSGSSWHTVYFDIKNLNVNELMFTSEAGVMYGKVIFSFTEYSSLLKSGLRVAINENATLNFQTNGNLEIYSSPAHTLGIYYR